MENLPKKPFRWVGATAIRFSLVGAATGLLLGVYEAALIWWRARHLPSPLVSVGPVIWILSPLVDLLLFSLLGLGLGLAAGKWLSESRLGRALMAVLGFGAAGKFAVSVTLASHIVEPEFRGLIRGLAFPLIGGMAFAIFMIRDKHRKGRLIPCPQPPRIRSSGWSVRVLVLAALLLVAGLWVHWIRDPNLDLPAVSSFGPSRHPNIVLIAVDTFAAGHSSTYGYARPTTPNLTALSRRGTLFENAIAPSSWTLASFISMFTGQLPHQHGADFNVPWRGRSSALAEGLSATGYETAGFNANCFYGDAFQGIGRGFFVYQDCSSLLVQNFSQTLIGRSIEKWIYRPLAHHGFMGRLNASEVNRDIARWYRHRSGRPYFLFINYIDAHEPYDAPAPFKGRYGDVPGDLARLMEPRNEDIGPRTHHVRLSASAQAGTIAGYDDALAYVDDQIGEILNLLAGSPDWANTYVIVTSDHGEAFGEHGWYGHAWDLYREVLHVPLVVSGPDVPAGLRVADVVGTLKIFRTVLDLATHPELPSRLSLRRYWEASQTPTDPSEATISELHWGSLKGEVERTTISLTTDRWHYIQDSQGNCQLFDWTRDPLEQTNLASKPEEQSIIASFQAQLGHRLSESSQPWLGPYYLLAVGSFRLPLPHAMGSRALPAEKTTPEQGELLESLPYH